ncbi:MAG: DUF333 domain-containing protein [Candidatus Aenigmarchaeota archaeon]|nr:DUF333 domain-containing protein [Candidatus Aenigmarchaeota archaeon]
MLVAECADINYIINSSDYIIEGTVEKVESRFGEGGNIFTYADILIEKYVKGDPFTEDRLQIITPGGTVGVISQWVEDQPIFHEGKRVRIHFLERDDGNFSIVCEQFGVVDISGGAGLPNPAAVYCERDKGGVFQGVETPKGTIGYCSLPDGRVCEEWAFFNSNGTTCNPPEE